MAKRTRKTKTVARVKKYLESDSLARAARRAKKKLASKAKRTNRKLKSRSKKGIKSFWKTRKKLAKSGLRSIKAARKSIKRKRKESQREKKKRQAAARKQLRAAARGRVRQEILGEADISSAKVNQASEDPGSSRPGEPPKMRTGKGRSAIKAELVLKGSKLQSRVYVDKKIAGYMAMYEFRQDGEERPFLKPGLMNNLQLIGQTIGTELREQLMRKPKKKASVK